MAEFNPRTSDTGVINETSRSRGTGPNRTFETLFSGLTETASNIMQIQDTKNQLDIQEDARNIFDSVNQEFGVSAPTPDGVSEGLDQIQTLQNAFLQGKISEVNYYGRLATLSKQLRTKYPGYEGIVDSTIQSVTGTRPANAYRDALFSELGRLSSEASSEEKRKQKFLDDNAGIIGAIFGDDYFSNPDRYDFDAVQAEVGKFKGRAELIETENKQLTLMAKRGEFNDKRAARALDRDFAFVTESVLSRSVGANKPSFQSTLDEFVARGGGSPQEIDQFIGVISQAESDLRASLLQRGREKYVAAGLISNDDLNKAIDAAMYPLTEAKKAVLGGDFKLAARYATLNKSISDKSLNDLLEDPTIRVGAGLSQIDSSLGGEFLTRNAAHIDNVAAEIIGRTMQGQRDIVKRTIESGDQKVSRDVIEGNFLALKDQNISQGEVSNIVNQFFDPTALDFMDPRNVKAEDLETIYTKFLDPQITKAIFEKGSAEDKQKYTQWAVEKFKAIPAFAAAAGDVNSALESYKKFDPSASIVLDPNTLRLSIKTTYQPGITTGGGGVLTGTSAADTLAVAGAGRILNAFNKATSVLNPILEASGEDKQRIMGSIIQSLAIEVDGSNPEAKMNRGEEQTTFWGSVYESLMAPVGSLQSKEQRGETASNLGFEIPEQDQDAGDIDFMFSPSEEDVPEGTPEEVLRSFSEEEFISPRENPDVRPEVLSRFGNRRLPAAIRLNNPGAISIVGSVGKSFAAKQPGFTGVVKRPKNEGGYYAQFATPQHGIAAASKLLERYGRQGTNTAEKITKKWAAAPGNYPNVLVKYLREAGYQVSRNTPLDLSDPNVRIAILKAKSAHESGAGRPVYSDTVYSVGVNM